MGYHPSERVVLDTLKVVVLLAVIATVAILGRDQVLDASAVTGVLGTVVGAVGAQGSAAIAEHIRDKARSETRQEIANGQSGGTNP